MQHTEHITPNALLSIPDPNVAIMKKCKVLPIEFVVRGFMTGVYIFPDNPGHAAKQLAIYPTCTHCSNPSSPAKVLSSNPPLPLS